MLLSIPLLSPILRSPTENEILKCIHDRGNPFGSFAIKACLNGNPKAVCHLSYDISRLTKFVLDRGAEVEVTLTSKHYRRSPLTQSGLEIPCMVKVAMPGTLLNKKLLERYEEMVKHLYVEPEESAIMESFVFDDIFMGDEPRQPKLKKMKKERTQEKLALRDIRTMFSPVVKKRSTKLEKTVIILD